MLDECPRGPAFYAYSTNYLIDIDSAIVIDVEASSATLREEAKAARTMIDRSEERFRLKPERLIGDTGYGNAQMLGWLVEDKHITPHIPVLSKSEGKAGLFGRSDFRWAVQANHYVCPAGKHLGRNRRKFKTKRSGITKENTIIYRAAQSDGQSCPMKTQCCPQGLARSIRRSIHEDARDVARTQAKTDAYAQSRNDRKKVEMLFGHLKKIMRFDRLRLRGPNGAHDEFLLAATGQNLRKLAMLLVQPRPPATVMT